MKFDFGRMMLRMNPICEWSFNICMNNVVIKGWLFYPAPSPYFHFQFAIRFWGSNVFASSNIVFSNGDLDPWGSAGILEPNSANPSIIPVPVIGGAHHLDLRPDHRLDPPGVKEARNKEVFAISHWIKQFEARQTRG